MPVKSCDSSVLQWPDRQKVEKALHRWIRENASELNIVKVGYFGSYARGDWGVGSDLDLIILVKNSAVPFEKRTRSLNLVELPVPVDAIVYTQNEWDRIKRETPFGKKVKQGVIWLKGVS